MAFKRSAVRFRLAPPSFPKPGRDAVGLPAFQGSERDHKIDHAGGQQKRIGKREIVDGHGLSPVWDAIIHAMDMPTGN